MRANTSQPWKSYPNHAAPLGGAMLRSSVQSAGSAPANRRGATAIASTTTRIATDTQSVTPFVPRLTTTIGAIASSGIVCDATM